MSTILRNIETKNYNSLKKTKNFYLKNFRDKFPEYNFISEGWLIWFIGFFEGDGSLTIGKSNIEIIITQSEFDKDILLEIKEKFQFGQINVQKKINVPGKLWIYRYIVRDFKGQSILLTLFHNNLVLPEKKSKYNKFIKIYNEKLSRAKLRKKNFEKLFPLKNANLEIFTLPSKNDSWLCGFTDAEGCFYTGFTKDYVIRACFDLTQKTSKKYCCIEIFEHIKNNIFNCGIIRSKVNISSSESLYLEIRSSNLLKGLPLIHNYFNNFTLRTSKINNFLLQKEVVLKFKEFRNKKYLISSLKEQDKEQLINLIKHNLKNKKRNWKEISLNFSSDILD